MQDKFGLIVLGLVGIILFLLAYSFLAPLDAVAVGAGYLLFSGNYVLIASVMGRLLIYSSGKNSRTALTLISGLKFFGLFGLLYFLLVTCDLSGLYLAFGALISLLVLSAVLYVGYLRTLDPSEAPRV